MSSSINTRQIASSYPVHEARPAESLRSAPAVSEPKVEVRQVAQQTFAIKSEVSTDMQRIQLSMEEAVQQLNDMLKNSGRNLNIGIDRALGGPVVVVRSEAGDVVRQIPNETVVRMAHSIEAFKGWLHDQKV
jgi:flagellar protein FlaG